MKNPYKNENLKKMPPPDKKREAELSRVEREAVASFHGQLDDLSAALGMLRMGDHFGWRVLVLIHNKRTIRKYEDILDIKIREFFPEEAAQSHRSNAFKLAKAIGNFWKVVSGEIKIDDRRKILRKAD